MIQVLRLVSFLLLTLLWPVFEARNAWGQTQPEAAENLILITLDGLRWQELFGGGDLKLMNKEAGAVRDVKTLKKRFWHESAEKRRKLLMPFFWDKIAEEGQLIGDPDLGAEAACTNGLYFSYPGESV